MSEQNPQKTERVIPLKQLAVTLGMLAAVSTTGFIAGEIIEHDKAQTEQTLSSNDQDTWDKFKFGAISGIDFGAAAVGFAASVASEKRIKPVESPAKLTEVTVGPPEFSYTQDSKAPQE